MTLKELLKLRGEKVTAARAIVTKAEGESRVLSAEESTQVETLTTEAEGLSDQIGQRQRLERLEGQVDANGHRAGDPLPHHTSKQPYSILRAIRMCMQHRPVDGLEGEVSQELIRRRGRGLSQGNGFVVPLDLPMREQRLITPRGIERRTGVIDTTTGAGGIPTILDTTYIDILRNRLVIKQAGARVLTDMVGNFAIPRQNAAATAAWVAESSAPTGSNQTLDQVAFTPKTIAAFTDISRRFAEQVNTDAEEFVRADLIQIIARAVDLAGLNGTGADNQPKGILQNSSVTTYPIGSTGGAPSWAMAVGMETIVAAANADLGDLSYITNAKVRGTLKQTPKVGTTYPLFIWENDEVNGYPVHVTNAVPSNLVKTTTGLSAMIFGNFADLIVAFWSGLDVIVDPYTGSSSGTVRIVALQDCDVNVRHPESFSKCLDIVTG